MSRLRHPVPANCGNPQNAGKSRKVTEPPAKVDGNPVRRPKALHKVAEPRKVPESPAKHRNPLPKWPGTPVRWPEPLQCHWSSHQVAGIPAKRPEPSETPVRWPSPVRRRKPGKVPEPPAKMAGNPRKVVGIPPVPLVLPPSGWNSCKAAGTLGNSRKVAEPPAMWPVFWKPAGFSTKNQLIFFNQLVLYKTSES